MTVQPAPSAPPQAPTARHLARHPSLPPYLETAADLRQQIHSGHLPPGHLLPPLRVMAVHYKIAIVTARSALRVLQDEGLVYTRQGRGSFVAAPPYSVTPTGIPPTCECARLERRIDELTAALQDLLQPPPQSRLGRMTAAQSG
ncbi:GntR family transcriptional regulator [Streptomyces sp. NPDC001890]|uniref:GntR family transcriptional regulator n=1 Tax=Streptomyces sp. NPDC001890 TaxID=3364620 RepID=UPI003677ECA6